MRIGQILFADAPFYERKSQAMDAAALAIGHQILPTADGAQLLHVYAPLQFPASRLSGVKVPYVANGRPSDSVFHSRPRQPARNVLPFGAQPVPEAVASEFFDQRATRASPRARKTIGSLRRNPRDDAIRLATMSRMARFRDDVDWRVFAAPLKPTDLTALDVWVDATEDDRDLDGLGAEAIVAGVPVVATRTPVNKIRLADGRSGFLVWCPRNSLPVVGSVRLARAKRRRVDARASARRSDKAPEPYGPNPPGRASYFWDTTLVPVADPNELTHAILTALFKPELTQPRVDHGLSTRDRFRSERRTEKLIEIYEELVA